MGIGQQVSEAASQQASESASQQVSKSASQRVSKSASQRGSKPARRSSGCETCMSEAAQNEDFVEERRKGNDKDGFRSFDFVCRKVRDQLRSEFVTLLSFRGFSTQIGR